MYLTTRKYITYKFELIADIAVATLIKIEGDNLEEKKFKYGPIVLFFVASTLLLLINGGN